MKNDRMMSGKGFTLIELMIVLAMVGILAAVAYPSFVAMLIRSDRSDARAALMSVQLAQERHRMRHTEYGTLEELSLPLSDGKYVSEKGLYEIDLVAGSVGAGGYALEAVARGKQENDVADCQTIRLTVNQGGEQRTPAACW
jgi:type IV pilus assembly protein PilE